MPSHHIDYSSDNDMSVPTTPSKRSTRLSNRNQRSATTPDLSTSSSPRSTTTRRLTRARVSGDTSNDPSARSSAPTRRQRTTRSSASSSNSSSPDKVASTSSRQTTPRRPTATTPRRASSRLRPNTDKEESTSEDGESENSAPLHKSNHPTMSLALEPSDDAADEEEEMDIQNTESETGDGKSVGMETDGDEAEEEDVEMDEEDEELAEEGDEEEEEEEEEFSSDEEFYGTMQPSSQPLTKRQRAKLTGGMEEELLELPQESKRRVMTEEEIALKRSENTRRRKFQTMKKLEQEQMDTINRLLKKQASKRSRKDEVEQDQNPQDDNVIPPTMIRTTVSPGDIKVSFPVDCEPLKREKLQT
ncbi:INO80 complex subunit B [Dispira parvispora]|uniref:INO80 complex subunit B n=1 Tax=Dispira parvispora TaxID=1520584 RepID=A0A9W8E3H6_9FUNG|nr:INO80 complex subunit B [Dispira parvispora]